MANQFSAKIRFDPVAWRAYDKETGAMATVIDHVSKVKWSVVFRNDQTGVAVVYGFSPKTSSARAACRRAIARHVKALQEKKTGKKRRA